MTITFWNRNKVVSKTFKKREKLVKFLRKHNVRMYDMNGQTYLHIGGNR